MDPDQGSDGDVAYAGDATVVDERMVSKMFCFRCGSAGHPVTECTNPIPSQEDLESAISEDLYELVNEVGEEGGYGRDEFGVVIRSDGGISLPTESMNWDGHKFCINCGSEGHTFSTCEHFNTAQLVSTLNRFWGRDGVSKDEVFMSSKLAELWEKRQL